MFSKNILISFTYETNVLKLFTQTQNHNLASSGYQVGSVHRKDTGRGLDPSIHLQNTQHHTLDLPFL